MEAKEKAKNIELIINLCKEMSENNEKDVVLRKLEQLFRLGVIDDLRIDEWETRYESNKRDDLDIIEPASHKIFALLFQQPKEAKNSFLWSNIKLVRLIMDLYTNKEHNDFYFFNLKSMTDTFKKELLIEDHKQDSIAYNETKHKLKEFFPLNKRLSQEEYESFCKELESFKYNLQARTVQNFGIFKTINQAVRDYCIGAIKKIKRKGDQNLNRVISDLYLLAYIPNDKDNIRLMKNSLKFDSTNMTSYYRLAKSYEGWGKETKALKTWNMLIQHYFKKTEKINIRKLKDTLNEVGKIQDSALPEFLFQHLIVKKAQGTFPKSIK